MPAPSIDCSKYFHDALAPNASDKWKSRNLNWSKCTVIGHRHRARGEMPFWAVALAPRLIKSLALGPPVTKHEIDFATIVQEISEKPFTKRAKTENRNPSDKFCAINLMCIWKRQWMPSQKPLIIISGGGPVRRRRLRSNSISSHEY